MTYCINDPRFEQNGNVFTWQTDSGDIGEYIFMITVSDYSLADSLEVVLIVNQLCSYLPGDVNMALGIWPPSVIGGDVTALVSYFIGGGSISYCLDYEPAWLEGLPKKLLMAGRTAMCR